MKTISIIKNKRGGIASILVDFSAYIVFAIVIILFYEIFSFKSGDVKSIQSANVFDKDIFLSSYLKTPVIVDGKEINMAELIRYWYFDKTKYENLLSKTSLEILNKNEYEYEDPVTKNIRIRGFNVVISKEKRTDNSYTVLQEFNSKSAVSGYRISDDKYGGAIILGEQFIPISDTTTLYIFNWETQKAK